MKKSHTVIPVMLLTLFVAVIHQAIQLQATLHHQLEQALLQAHKLGKAKQMKTLNMLKLLTLI